MFPNFKKSMTTAFTVIGLTVSTDIDFKRVEFWAHVWKWEDLINCANMILYQTS
jgi:hypothetical protein